MPPASMPQDAPEDLGRNWVVHFEREFIPRSLPTRTFNRLTQFLTAYTIIIIIGYSYGPNFFPPYKRNVYNVRNYLFLCQHGQVRTARRSAGEYIIQYDIYAPWLESLCQFLVIRGLLGGTDRLINPPWDVWLGGKKVEQTGLTLGLSEIRTATPHLCMITYRHTPLIYSQRQLRL